MKLGVMFFSSDDEPDHPYELMLQTARLADDLGYSAIWVPERHFHRFGGIFPNPAVALSALTQITRQISLRAGSVVTPLHDPLRIAEDWAMVDQLSGGRVGISFATGWNANDFVLAPDAYRERYRLTEEAVSTIRACWDGAGVKRRNGDGDVVSVTPRPRPASRIPIWVTASTNIDTFRMAGRLGANVLTQLVQHDFEALAERIDAYRRSYVGAGANGSGLVSVMLHALLMEDRQDARAAAKPHLLGYLRSSLALEVSADPQKRSRYGDVEGRSAKLVEPLLERAYDRYVEGASLIGDAADCSRVLDRIADAGADEVACLVDFGPPPSAVAETLRRLADVSRQEVVA